MPWVKLDDAFFTDEAAMAAGPEGRLLFIAGLCHASRNLTDGAIDKRALPSVAMLAGANPETATLLVDLGLWVDEGASYRAPRYLDFNPSRKKVLEDRELARQRMSVRRSADVRPNTNRSSSSPVPVPSPSETLSSSSSDARAAVPDEVWTIYAEKKLQATRDVQSPEPWKRTAARNARKEWGERAAWLWEHYEITPSHLADVLIDGGTSQSVSTLRKKEAS